MKEIFPSIQTRREDLIAFLREIIAIPSPCGREAAVIERISAEMTRLGYDEVRLDGLGNCLGRIGSGKRLLVLDGHCDTVAAGGREQWRHDPYAALLRDGVIYGRGAADQKGGLAAAVYAGAVLKTLGLPQDISLLVTASVLEEDFEGLCWRYLIEAEQLVPKAVILTEPSDLSLRIGQRGRLEMKVTVRGRSCHGSAPQLGDNAIYKMTPVVQDIEALNRSLSGDSPLGPGSISVTDIRSSAPSLCALPDKAVIHLDRRLTEGETRRTARAEIEKLPAVTAARAAISIPRYRVKSYTGLELTQDAFYPAWLMDRNHPLVRTAEDTSRKILGRDPHTGVWAFSTNGVATKGSFGIPTIGLGPGREADAHTVGDQVKADDVVSAAAWYTALISELAGKDLSSG